MAKKPGKKLHDVDLDQSIQVALDAAEASMDVTAEFDKISAQFTDTTANVKQLQKTARNGIIAAGGIAVIAVLLMGAIWQRSSTGLERLAATNTELLSMLTENISSFDEKAKSIQDGGAQLVDLETKVEGLGTNVQGILESTMVIPELRSSVAQVTIEMTDLDTQSAAALRDEQLVTNLGDRISTLNGELAMTVSVSLQDNMNEQMEDYRTLVSDVSKALESIDSGAGSEAIAAIQRKMDAKVNDLNMRIKQMKKDQKARPKKSKKSTVQPDIIKYP
jgi:hypothetical protein